MKFTLSLKHNYEFRRLYTKGASAVGANLVVYCRKRKGPGNRLGITVGAKVGNAVNRNRVRRRIKEIYRLNEDKLRPGLDIVVVARARSRHAKYRTLESEFLTHCGKLGLLMGNNEKDSH